MERVISLLFDIEKKANQIIERANLEKTELYNENEKAILAMEESIAEESNAKIDLLIKQAEQELEKEKEQLIETSNRQLHEIEANFEQNRDAIVNKVFSNIISAS